MAVDVKDRELLREANLAKIPEFRLIVNFQFDLTLNQRRLKQNLEKS